MEILDEKQQPGPPMEVDEPVSVRDREFKVNRDLNMRLIVLEDEAFAAKHLPDLGHDVKDFQVFSWRLDRWRSLEKKLTSADFECGGHKW
jgi:ubiquitin carboxyl-terminal hydrolase 7